MYSSVITHSPFLTLSSDTPTEATTGETILAAESSVSSANAAHLDNILRLMNERRSPNNNYFLLPSDAHTIEGGECILDCYTGGWRFGGLSLPLHCGGYSAYFAVYFHRPARVAPQYARQETALRS